MDVLVLASEYRMTNQEANLLQCLVDASLCMEITDRFNTDAPPKLSSLINSMEKSGPQFDSVQVDCIRAELQRGIPMGRRGVGTSATHKRPRRCTLNNPRRPIAPKINSQYFSSDDPKREYRADGKDEGIHPKTIMIAGDKRHKGPHKG